MKKVLFWSIIILYFEFMFFFFSYDAYHISSIINIFLFSIIHALFLSIITGLFSEKINNIIKYIFLVLFGFSFSLQFVFSNIFNSYFSLSVFGLSDQLTKFMGETINAILSNTIMIILFFLPLILSIIFRKKISFFKNNIKQFIIILISFIIFMILFFINVNIQKKSINSIYDLLFNINENSLNIEKLGVITSGILDVERTIFGFEVEFTNPEIDSSVEVTDPEEVEYGYNILDLDFTKKTNSSNIKTINNYISSLSATKKNEYTGIFEGYNLVYITAESFSQIAVREDVTPTLYKLVNSGFVFNNFYTPNNLSTIGGEFQSITGLYANNKILTKWRSGKNYFPFGLSTVFEKKNYSTFAYHNNYYKFQDRHKYLKSLGFDNYKGCSNGLEELINCKIWPESDVEMINATVEDYINKEPFLAYYMSVSGHFEYSFTGNNMAIKHKSEVSDLDYSESAKAYLATQIELDQALEILINKLDEAGVLDRTVIVLLADHYPYKLSLTDINSLSSYKRDNVVGVNHNSLIIWNSNLEKVEVDKTCMSIDVIPTIYNLFGIEYDSRLFVGNDIFSDSEGIAIMSNRSWVTDLGTYYASSNKFVSNGQEVDYEYIKRINAIVSNRMNISRLIVSNNYYDYLFN